MDKWDLILGRLKNKAEKVISKPKKMVFFHKHCPLVMFRKIALAIAFSPRMEALIAESKRLKDSIFKEDVSNEIASRFNVYHESPQLILIRNGKAVYDVSHSDIDAEALKSKI